MYSSVPPGFLGNVFSCIVLWVLWWWGFPSVAGKPRTWGKRPNSSLPLSRGLSKWHMNLAASGLGTLLSTLKTSDWRLRGVDPQGAELWHHWRQEQPDAGHELPFSEVAEGTWRVPFFSKCWGSASGYKCSQMEIPNWDLHPPSLLRVFPPRRH